MKLNIVASTTKDGIMSTDEKYFPNLTKEERTLLYKLSVTKFLKKLNVQSDKYFILNENNSIMSAKEINSTSKNTKEKIYILTSDTPNMPVLVETSDNPIIVASVNMKDNKSVCAIALGTLKNIDDNIIHEMIEALIRKTDAAPFEMTFYIGACPSKEKYLITEKLKNEDIWSQAITTKKKEKYIDLRFAIFNQLRLEIVDPNYIYFDSKDTTENVNYYSDLGNKPGKNIICVVYQDEEEI